MRIELHFPSESTEIHAEPQDGLFLTQVLRHRGLPLNTRCGERGLCKACQVEVLRGGEWVVEQACACPVEDGLQVRVSQAALLAYAPQVQSGFKLGVPFAHNPLFASEGLAAAVDIGTTTVAILLVDQATGKTAGSAVGFNQQMKLGDDVLTRINHCLVEPSMISDLQKAIVQDTLKPLMEEALTEAGAQWSDIRGLAASGNTTMLHLLVGEDPSPLGVVPFTPAFLELREAWSDDIGLPARFPLVCLPGAAAYVGADIIAGMVASGFAYDQGSSLFVDAGTNGEMVVHRMGRKIGCATAAGPAFEGSGLSCGVRAGHGAISHVVLHQMDGSTSAEIEVIGGPEAGRPIGLCGSAYVDFLDEARRTGLVNSRGRLQGPSLLDGEYGKEFLVAPGQGRRPLVVADSDISLLLQAKAAIAAGIRTLLGRVDLEPDEVDTLVLAGGFGMHLNLNHAIGCGLLPGFRPEQISLVGNTSLGGAFLAVMDRSTVADMSQEANELEVIELNQDPDFEDAFIDALSLE